MRTAGTLIALAALGASVSAEVNITKPDFEPTTIKAHFLEQFTDDWSDRWTPSEATKKTPVGGETFSYVGKWAVEESSNLHAINGDKGLVAKTKAAHHAISVPFATPLDPTEGGKKPLVVQYEVKYQKGGNCGGGYLKLLEDGYQSQGQDYNDKTNWVVMFGPDLTCPGTKVHFIFRHQNPITKEYEEKHLSSPPMPTINDATMLYTLIVNPDNTYEILVDDESKSSGSLLDAFTPPVNPPTEIDDADDKKPEEWIDTEKYPDPSAVKPEDWDEEAPYSIIDEEAVKPEGWLDNEPLQVADPDAEKPEEWDEEEDGEWSAPTIANPKCAEAPGCGEWTRPTKANPDFKGKWSAPQIDHPDYKGVWAPRKIANPNYFEDKNPAKLNKIGGVGIELWTMTEDILFDNIYIGHSVEDAKKLAGETFHVKKPIEAAQAEELKPKTEDDESSSITSSFKEAPIQWLREQALEFFEAVKEDPVAAFKSKPETGVALLAVLLTFLGSFGALFGLVGGSSPSPAAKKIDVPSKKEKKAVAADAAASVPTIPPVATDEKSAATKRK